MLWTIDAAQVLDNDSSFDIFWLKRMNTWNKPYKVHFSLSTAAYGQIGISWEIIKSKLTALRSPSRGTLELWWKKTEALEKWPFMLQSSVSRREKTTEWKRHLERNVFWVTQIQPLRPPPKPNTHHTSDTNHKFYTRNSSQKVEAFSRRLLSLKAGSFSDPAESISMSRAVFGCMGILTII